MAQIPTTDQLRHRIDSGSTGEKVDFPDPAAAPLGTDDEAAGNSPTLLERAMEARAQPSAKSASHVHAVPIVLTGIAFISAAIMLIVWAAMGGR